MRKKIFNIIRRREFSGPTPGSDNSVRACAAMFIVTQRPSPAQLIIHGCVSRHCLLSWRVAVTIPMVIEAQGVSRWPVGRLHNKNGR